MFASCTLNKADVLHGDTSSVWGEKVLETAGHVDQFALHAVACENLHIAQT